MARKLTRCLTGECRKSLVTFETHAEWIAHTLTVHDVEWEPVDIDAVNEV